MLIIKYHKGQNKRFWDCHNRSWSIRSNCSPETLGSKFRAPGPKNLKKDLKKKFNRHYFEISRFQVKNQIVIKESEYRSFETLGIILRAPGLKATIKKVKISKA